MWSIYSSKRNKTKNTRKNTRLKTQTRNVLYFGAKTKLLCFSLFVSFFVCVCERVCAAFKKKKNEKENNLHATFIDKTEIKTTTTTNKHSLFVV